MRKETTAEWIEAEMTRVLHSYPKDEVNRAIPVLLLLMARDFGFANLRPDMQDAVVRVARLIGLYEGMPEDDAKMKTVIYVHNLRVNPEILKDVKTIFDTHTAALAESSAEGFRKHLRARPARAPTLEERRAPKPSDAIISAELLRKATGMIRS